jgi:hypothetical protein
MKLNTYFIYSILVNRYLKLTKLLLIMELSEIWIGIIIPIVIGPIFVYLKSLRDEVVERRFRRLREKYDEERNTIFNELKTFYWPVFINLLCIQQYSYSLPIKNRFRYESKSSLGEFNSNSSESDDYFPPDESKKPLEGNKTNKTNKINDINLKPIDKSLVLNTDNNSDNFEITIPINEHVSPQEVEDNIKMDIISNPSSISSFTKRKTIILDKSTLKMLEENLNNKFRETVEIIEENIALVCIHQNLNTEIINFIKYARLREIIQEGSPESEYNIGYLCVDNNTDKFLSEILPILTNLNTKYTDLINNPI